MGLHAATTHRLWGPVSCCCCVLTGRVPETRPCGAPGVAPRPRRRRHQARCRSSVHGEGAAGKWANDPRPSLAWEAGQAGRGKGHVSGYAQGQEESCFAMPWLTHLSSSSCSHLAASRGEALEGCRADGVIRPSPNHDDPTACCCCGAAAPGALLRLSPALLLLPLLLLVADVPVVRMLLLLVTATDFVLEKRCLPLGLQVVARLSSSSQGISKRLGGERGASDSAPALLRKRRRRGEGGPSARHDGTGSGHHALMGDRSSRLSGLPHWSSRT